MDFFNYNKAINEGLNNLIITDDKGIEIDINNGFDTWINMTFENAKFNKNIFIIGNGASASIASHMAADATKNGKLRALTFNDSALMTAVSNDIDYKSVFAIPLERFSNANDMLISISSSGNSPNIIAAVESAKKNGLKVITLSGLNNENLLRSMGHVNYYVPLNTYGEVECAHQIIIHYWLDKYMNKGGLTI